MLRIGLFSDDRALQPLLSSALGKGFQLLSVDETALERSLQADAIDVLLVDFNEAHSSTTSKARCCSRLLTAELPVPMVIMADDSLRSQAAELVRLGAFGYLRRPPSVRDLKAMLLRTHETYSLKRKQEAAPPSLPEVSACCDRLTGSSARMQEVYDLIRRVAGVHASVLVTGESGTGKELIATAIHNLGKRSREPFIAVSCGAIPETLIEAELFGHEKGAFTGTVGSRVGYMEQAGEGTLFLDEIGDLSLSTQVKLLRVLQQREFCRLGSTKVLPLKARLVFATHRDLGEMVAQGTFRQDLYYRINVMRIHAPALREHREDVAEIATYLLRQYSESYQKPISSIDPEAMAALESYAWPGNVRELENIVQRAIILAQGASIRLEDLSQHIIDHAVAAIDEFPGAAGSFERLLRDYKIKLAVAAVREHDGNKTLAARSLQISRAYLHRLLRAAGQDEIVTDIEDSRLELA